MTDIIKEKERKKRYYEKNKEKILAQKRQKRLEEKVPKETTEEKTVENSLDIRWKKIISVLTCLAICLTSSTILIAFTADAMGSTLVSWACAILLEASIVILAVVSPKNRMEWWIAKIFFVVFLVASIIILHTGIKKKIDPVSDAKVKLSQIMIDNAKNMPKDHTSNKKQSLDSAKNLLDEVKAAPITEQEYTQDMTIRIFLTIENLIFAYMLHKMV